MIYTIWIYPPSPNFSQFISLFSPTYSPTGPPINHFDEFAPRTWLSIPSPQHYKERKRSFRDLFRCHIFPKKNRTYSEN